MGPTDRVLWDLTITDQPDTFELFRDEFERNYSATATWLRTFLAFCRSARGFEVS